MYHIIVAACLLLGFAQGTSMCNLVRIRCSGTWLILLLILTSAATATVLFADPQDVTVEANQWAQFNCTVHCSHTSSVGWYMAGYHKK